jgi:hypothetical protein
MAVFITTLELPSPRGLFILGLKECLKLGRTRQLITVEWFGGAVKPHARRVSIVVYDFFPDDVLTVGCDHPEC